MFLFRPPMSLTSKFMSKFIKCTIFRYKNKIFILQKLLSFEALESSSLKKSRAKSKITIFSTIVVESDVAGVGKYEAKMFLYQDEKFSDRLEETPVSYPSLQEPTFFEFRLIFAQNILYCYRIFVQFLFELIFVKKFQRIIILTN